MAYSAAPHIRPHLELSVNSADDLFGPRVDPGIVVVVRVRGQSARPMSGTMERGQGRQRPHSGSGRQSSAATCGSTRLSTAVQPWRHNPVQRFAARVARAAAAGGATTAAGLPFFSGHEAGSGDAATDAGFVFVMEEVAARPIGTVAVDPVLLAELRLVLVLLARVPHLVAAVGKLALVAVEAGALLLEVATDLSLETRIGRLITVAPCGL